MVTSVGDIHVRRTGRVEQRIKPRPFGARARPGLLQYRKHTAFVLAGAPHLFDFFCCFPGFDRCLWACGVESQKQAQRLAGGELHDRDDPEAQIDEGQVYGKEAGSQVVQINKTAENPK